MAAKLMRRSVATAAFAALATVASPLVGTALATTDPALTAGTFNPADGATVAANRPPISVQYNTELNLSKSTITLTNTTTPTSTAPACPAVFSSDKKTIGCTPQADLVDGDTYKVAVHAENADSSSKLDESASWTVDIPSVTSRSLSDNSTVGVLTSISETFDEEISPSSTVDVVDGHGNHLLGNVSVAKSGATGACPLNPCILKYSTSSSAGLGAGTYTATFTGVGVTNSTPSGSTPNPDAYGLDVVHFTVVKTQPPAKPEAVQGPANGITQANVDKVPFHGWAVPGFNVGVAIYDEVADSAGNCASSHQREGFGCQDGFGYTYVDPSSCNSTDPATAPITSPDGVQLCYFTLTVDDSAGCDTDTSSNPLCIEWPGTADNQWYAFSYSGPGSAPGAQNPTGPSPSSDPHINRDTTGPSQPDNADAHVNSDTSTDTAIVTWTAHDSNNDALGYRVTAIDPEGHSVSRDYLFPTPAVPDPTHADTDTLNVSSLDDGLITVHVAAYDEVGNASTPVNANLTPPKVTPSGTVNYTLTKESRIVAPVSPAPDSDTLVAGGNTILFSSLNSNVHVPVPTKVTVYFNEPIRLLAQDTTSPSGPTTIAKSWICLRDGATVNDGSCVNTPGVGTYALTSDKTGLVWSPPTSFTSGLQDGVYSFNAIGVAATCQDKTPTNPNPPACEVSSDPGPTLTSFHLDTVGPNVAITSVTNPITARNVKSVQIGGTADAEATAVELAVKSSGGGPTLLLTQSLTPPSDPAVTTVNWTFFPVDFSQVRDGTLTITATAFDAAQNKKTSAPVTTTETAHVSTLTEKVSSSTIVFGHVVLVSGRLVDANGAPISGATIVVKPRYGDGTYGRSASGTTGSTGTWGVLISAAHNATWYASYAGSTASPLHDATTVHTARTLVKVAIAFTSPKNNSTVGSPVVLKGKVAPNKHGVYVAIYRHTSSGNTFVGKAKLDRYSRWAFSMKLPRGTFKFFAVIGRTTGNLGNRTSYLTLKH